MKTSITVSCRDSQLDLITMNNSADQRRSFNNHQE